MREEWYVMKFRYLAALIVGILIFSSNALASCILKNDNDENNFSRCLSQAQKGDAEAQKNLGNLYVFGQGVSKNYNEALKWYRKGAEQGHARSQSNLGNLYLNGLGVPQDDKEAAKWYLKAA